MYNTFFHGGKEIPLVTGLSAGSSLVTPGLNLRQFRQLS